MAKTDFETDYLARLKSKKLDEISDVNCLIFF